MLKQHKEQMAGLFRLIDLSIITLAFLVAYYLRFGSFSPNIFTFSIQYQIFFFVSILVWVFLSGQYRLYASKRMTSFRREAVDVFVLMGASVVIAAIPAFFIREYPLSRIFLVDLVLIESSALILFRFIGRAFLKHLRRRGHNFRQLLIVGRNARAAQLIRKIEETPEFGYRILGYIDAPNGQSAYRAGLNCLGELPDLEKVLRNQIVDEVFVFLPMKSFYGEIEEILRICENVGSEVKIPIDLFSLKVAKSTISLYDDIPVIDIYSSPKMTWQFVLKRIMDITISATLLILLSPLFVLVGSLIKDTSRGPVFFKQERVGYNGRFFGCLKFRTMVENAEELKKTLTHLNEVDGPVFKIRNDPRVTTVGQVLRKTSIDELPQLINVLRGDMSLVGPRPPIPSEVRQYDLPHLRRLSMRPGITGLWQVNGRSAVGFDKWMELDKKYIDEWSLWLDLKILAKTVPAVIRGAGAA
jgi:exopolysaccharide biosynthesis polyprenyl glycosylphosphotransferase